MLEMDARPCGSVSTVRIDRCGRGFDTELLRGKDEV